MRVIHHERLPQAGHFSIERVFREIRSCMPEDIRVESVRCPRPGRGVVPRLQNVVHASRRPADVHHVVGDSHYLAFGLSGPRTILTIHDCAALNRLRGLKRAILKYFWFTGPMRRAAVVTTISGASKRELRRWTGSLADGVEIVPDCVFSEFVFDPKPFDVSAPVCLQVGTKWNKNLDRVAGALAGTGCRLDIVGALNDAQKRVLTRSGVPFRELGHLSDAELVEAYRRSDFVVFASLYEGFGLPVLEAQATGRPVITSNTGPMPEAAGDGALFADPSSVESIRHAVLEILKKPDLRAELVRRGSQNAEKHRPEAVARRYAEIYRRVAGVPDDARA